MWVYNKELYPRLCYCGLHFFSPKIEPFSFQNLRTSHWQMEQFLLFHPAFYCINNKIENDEFWEKNPM